MKNYLLVGLALLIGTNLVILSSVAYNRMNEPSAQLTLTERELALPHNRRANKENSGMSLAIKWRVPTDVHESYYSYQSKKIPLSSVALVTLGFMPKGDEKYYAPEAKELYWAFEFGGELHKTEIMKTEKSYQTAIKAFDANPSDKNSHNKKEWNKRLTREKVTNSRLFFIEAAADYALLAKKFTGNKKIVIVKGVSKPYYNKSDNTYQLQLQHLSVKNIMIPLQQGQVLSTLTQITRQKIVPPRYAVDVKWGKRLEPWVSKVKAIGD